MYFKGLWESFPGMSTYATVPAKLALLALAGGVLFWESDISEDLLVSRSSGEREVFSGEAQIEGGGEKSAI